MTIASSNGLNDQVMAQGTGAKLTVQPEIRPDRTHSYRKDTDHYPIPETSQEDMSDAVRTMLLSVGEDPSGRGCSRPPSALPRPCGF
jgi:GTP cyclohydrolase I